MSQAPITYKKTHLFATYSQVIGENQDWRGQKLGSNFTAMAPNRGYTPKRDTLSEEWGHRPNTLTHFRLKFAVLLCSVKDHANRRGRSSLRSRRVDHGTTHCRRLGARPRVKWCALSNPRPNRTHPRVRGRNIAYGFVHAGVRRRHGQVTA